MVRGFILDILSFIIFATEMYSFKPMCVIL